MASVRSHSGLFHVEPRDLPGRRFLSGLATYLSAIREASAAARTYDDLVRCGTPHGEAVKRVFDKHFSGTH